MGPPWPILLLPISPPQNLWGLPGWVEVFANSIISRWLNPPSAIAFQPPVPSKYFLFWSNGLHFKWTCSAFKSTPERPISNFQWRWKRESEWIISTQVAPAVWLGLMHGKVWIQPCDAWPQSTSSFSWRHVNVNTVAFVWTPNHPVHQTLFRGASEGDSK